MTKIMLARTSMLATAWKRRCRLFLLSPAESLDVFKDRLSAGGHLTSEAEIRSPWEDVITWTDRALRSLVGDHLQDPRSVEDTLEFGGDRVAERFNAKGKALQTDHFRSDGTVAASYRRDMKVRGELGGARLTLFDRRGRVSGEWRSATSFYYSWLDEVIGRRPTYLFSDSHFAGGLLGKYRNPSATTIQTIHSPHLQRRSDPLGPLTKNKIGLFKDLDGFDLVATLTQRHLDDLTAAGIAGPNVSVVPNPQAPMEHLAPNQHERARGITMARLDKVKRLEHAIRAVAATTSEATLDIYGRGPEEDFLQGVIDELGVGDRVRLRGFDKNASHQLKTAGFSLLTSSAEGQPLAILESMAVGCPPVAYDMRYGPSDMIQNRVNGYLVPERDVEAVAEAIDELIRMDTDQYAAMSTAAVARASDYSPETVTNRWADALTDAQSRRSKENPATVAANLNSLQVDNERVVFTIEVLLPPGEFERVTAMALTWMARKQPIYGRVFAEPQMTPRGLMFAAEVASKRLFEASEDFTDFYLDVWVDGRRNRNRLAAPTDVSTLPIVVGDLEAYPTKYGSLSLRPLRGE
ncbi:glycosyltransferase [Galactobacter sp.]|uniref:glycosyltransferase n=1 Tax=Galactobacter sp. TaxID=2676125 RepID=UPI0025B86B13|nr:glycosyltransferase [Galactobacter sp.]